MLDSSNKFSGFLSSNSKCFEVSQFRLGQSIRHLRLHVVNKEVQGCIVQQRSRYEWYLKTKHDLLGTVCTLYRSFKVESTIWIIWGKWRGLGRICWECMEGQALFSCSSVLHLDLCYYCHHTNNWTLSYAGVKGTRVPWNPSPPCIDLHLYTEQGRTFLVFPKITLGSFTYFIIVKNELLNKIENS